MSAALVVPGPRPRRSGRAGKLWTYLGMLLLVLFCLAPIYWMVVSAFRRASDIFAISLVPQPVSLDNFRTVFAAGQGFLRSLLNSFVVATATTVLTLVVAVSAGYALARLEFRFKRAFMIGVVSTSMFPTVALIVPMIQIFSGIGWINTYQAMILPSLSFVLPLSIWNLTTFFRQLPNELEQAAMVDGCTRGQAFRKIILPLSAPGIFSTAIIAFVTTWNEFLIPLSMTNQPSVQPATVVIARFSGGSDFAQPFGSQMAASVVVTIPIVVLVLAFQRRIV
ncbi:MAG TPA: carbohydrate ABC transporter permease, partial [Rhodopila sp.]